MFKPENRILVIELPLLIGNGNEGQKKHWGGHEDARKHIASAMRRARIMQKADDGSWHETAISPYPFTCRVDIWATRILGPKERLWDPDSILRGAGAKAMIDSLVDHAILKDDSSKYVRYCLGDQIDDARDQGPKWILEFFSTKK